MRLLLALNDVWYTIATGRPRRPLTVNVNDLSGAQEFAIYEALTCGSEAAPC
ncbi:MAG: hypothetical protein R2810_00590 [Flavobacteriales bacterium]